MQPDETQGRVMWKFDFETIDLLFEFVSDFTVISIMIFIAIFIMIFIVDLNHDLNR